MSADQLDLTVCPDCGRKQKKLKKYLDECENENCESFITRDKTTDELIWWNPNWDVPDDYTEDE